MIEEQKFTESLFEAPKIDQQERMVEAILFASSDPVTVKEIKAEVKPNAKEINHPTTQYECGNDKLPFKKFSK